MMKSEGKTRSACEGVMGEVAENGGQHREETVWE